MPNYYFISFETCTNKCKNNLFQWFFYECKARILANKIQFKFPYDVNITLMETTMYTNFIVLYSFHYECSIMNAENVCNVLFSIQFNISEMRDFQLKLDF